MIDGKISTKANVTEAELTRLCRSVFSGSDGAKLLEALCMYRHPMCNRFEDSDPIKAAVRDGEASVISFLWRNGANSDFI